MTKIYNRPGGEVDNVEVSLEDKSGFVSSFLGRVACLFLASVLESVGA